MYSPGKDGGDVSKKVKKLDSRFAGGSEFGYCIEFTSPYIDGTEFCAVREWCWTMWGPGREIKFIQFTEHNYKWAFLVDSFRTRIYLKGDEELNWYKLSWQ